MLQALVRYWPAAALLASAAMLTAAHGFEYFGYQPCALCLTQRQIYWGAIGVAVAALIIPRFLARPIVAATLDVLLGLVFLTGAVVAGYHAGVEWKFWPGPATCAGGVGPLGASAVADALNKTIHVTPCDEAAWRMFGISMAGYNALISLALAALSLLAAILPREGDDAGQGE